jgi:hypothetical protein
MRDVRKHLKELRGAEPPTRTAQASADVAPVVDWSGVEKARERLAEAEKALDEARLVSLTATQMQGLMDLGLRLGTLRHHDPWCEATRRKVEASKFPYRLALQACLDAQEALSQAQAAIPRARAAAFAKAQRQWVAQAHPGPTEL